MNQEAHDIQARFERRKSLPQSLYDPLGWYNAMVEAEKRLALIRWIDRFNLAPVCDKRVLEVGCENGPNLLQFILLGFRPENLTGIELIEESALYAIHRLPTATRILVGDASEMDLGEGRFDVVYQSTVFTSILDDDFQQRLARKMWLSAARGGGVLWYDYVYDNPWNPDVRGVPISRIRELFPHGRIKVWRLTLAPPIGRLVSRVSPRLYTAFNTFPFLRTHVLCWIQKS